MQKFSKTALLALLAGTIGFSAVAPASFAQETAPVPATVTDQAQKATPEQPGGFKPNRGQRGGGSLFDLVASDRGSEALEIAFVRLSHAIELTADQQTLFDALETTALAAQQTFADAATATREAIAEDQNLVDLLKARVTIDTARLAAYNDVLPQFEALYASLSDDQKAALEPRQGPEKFGQFGQNKFGPGQGGFPGQHGGKHGGDHQQGGPKGDHKGDHKGGPIGQPTPGAGPGQPPAPGGDAPVPAEG